jgi:hypothetical protein
MSVLGFGLCELIALRFNLDSYSNIWASPQAALLFWCAFAAVTLIVGITLWLFRRMRPH